ncbi:hypothetical protein ILUMI_15638 [Ignelater luminosus]|uniref:Uncharacterized protein n=1 Tax=Ignelater luminosus TaxID=2038154 RepID=A0A8K0G3P0_IGNLU|nr:hypothetical protein ILUMI_15638 [Ignelater luminosus]
MCTYFANFNVCFIVVKKEVFCPKIIKFVHYQFKQNHGIAIAKLFILKDSLVQFLFRYKKDKLLVSCTIKWLRKKRTTLRQQKAAEHTGREKEVADLRAVDVEANMARKEMQEKEVTVRVVEGGEKIEKGSAAEKELKAAVKEEVLIVG